MNFVQKWIEEKSEEKVTSDYFCELPGGRLENGFFTCFACLERRGKNNHPMLESHKAIVYFPQIFLILEPNNPEATGGLRGAKPPQD